MSWKEYYDKKAQKPNQSVQRAIAYFENNNQPLLKKAIDLGCGNAQDTFLLLAKDWEVYAIDSSPIAIEMLQKNVPNEFKNRLTFDCTSFEKMEWHKSTLLNASYSLPFCNKNQFPKLWEKLTNSIVTGGIFTGHFFGNKDDWQHLFLVTKQELHQLFLGFEILYLNEKEDNTPSVTGDDKHWHIFEIMAKKQ